MKILMINVVLGKGSTGHICDDVAAELKKRGHTVQIAYGRGKVTQEISPNHVKRIGNNLDVYIHLAKSRLFDDQGRGSVSATKAFLKWADEYMPDVLWLHNIHGYYLNYPLLFQWIKKHPSIKVKWTLHDCWAYTGHCTHYSYVGCDRWRTGCHNCPQKGEYPSSLFFDASEKNWHEKKLAFLGVKNMQLITPSEWLAQEVRKSFLSCYPVTAIPNGINLDIFRPVDSDIREMLGLQSKKIVLGVSNKWYQRKGENVFKELADHIGSDWQIVMIGVPHNKQKYYPKDILMIDRLDNREELVKWYSTADVLLNPSYEETMGLTSVEALACGTPVVLFDRTALPEVIDDTCGVVLRTEKMEDIINALEICRFSAASCRERAKLYSNIQFTEKCCEMMET